MTAEQPLDVLRLLHAGLRQRRTPQDVAAELLRLDILTSLDAAGARQLHAVARAARPASPFDCGVGTSMSTRWRRHPGLARAHQAAATAMAPVWLAAGAPSEPDASDPASLGRWVTAALLRLGLPSDEPCPARRTKPTGTVTLTYGSFSYTRRRTPNGRRGDTGGHADIRARLEAPARRERLAGVSVRAYRKAVRAVAHLQQRTAVLARERDREAAVAFGKSRLAHLIDEADFIECRFTAAFVAYFVARLGLRTQFTNGQQARPMDTLAEQLLRLALASPSCRPEVLAAVTVRRRVLDRLTDTQCGHLLGLYYEQLAACARVLRAADDPHRDPTHMVVRRGDDSSSWNAASRAFNQARTGWLALTDALGYDDVVEAACPGKVPALVASDVAHWHTVSGGDQHTDVLIAADLPVPWDVVLGDDDCPADLVRQVCRQHGVEPETTGWTSPYRQDHLERPAPAPDLVHGVQVSSPLLAGLLRDLGVFSGQAPSAAQVRMVDTLITAADRG
ncbi:hypothetical protein Lfu02_00080 [Longispora fulva]|uniref:Uncharacterized protein n=1 Tax=Longispora fulva TaxID=619741 RepID=A0A8J7GDT6_9ACTN|nr:hypothetical protein [Longispora fulva]MBG6136120.1 hypothetical protein [Longispora fulva]GIG55636.1 hypothetical protein Lfu02_00080 [Longispora fulva]